MVNISKLLSKSFDNVYHALNDKKICHKILEQDFLDGKVYSIDEFYDTHSIYFRNPCKFFKDFNDNAKFEIRDGIHPKQTNKLHAQTRMMLFDSPIKTESEENNLVPFKWFSTKNKRSNVILIFAPGWGRTSQSLEEKWCFQIQQSGIDTALLTKPYHQARTPAGSYSGEYFISANMFWTIANFRQFTAEIRLVIQYMRNFYDYIGIIGMSSGGFQASLALNCEEVDFYFPWITGCNFASITWHGILTQHIRKELERKGVTKELLAKVWSITDQAVVGGHCKAKNIKQYIAKYDTVIPTSCQYELWEILGKPDVKELETAHYSASIFGHKIMDDIVKYVKNCVRVK